MNITTDETNKYEDVQKFYRSTRYYDFVNIFLLIYLKLSNTFQYFNTKYTYYTFMEANSIHFEKDRFTNFSS